MKHQCPQCSADCLCEDFEMWGDCSHCGISPLTRLRAIARCMCELETIRGLWRRFPKEAVGIQIGELDWLGELHRLLYA